jgi:hypothetical protein
MVWNKIKKLFTTQKIEPRKLHGRFKFRSFNCAFCGKFNEGIFVKRKKYCNSICQQRVASKKYTDKLKKYKKKKIKKLTKHQAYQLFKQLPDEMQLDILNAKKQAIMKDNEFDKVIYALEGKSKKIMDLSIKKTKKRFYKLEGFKKC